MSAETRKLNHLTSKPSRMFFISTLLITFTLVIYLIASLLHRGDLLDSLGNPVRPVDGSVFGKGGARQIGTVVVFSGLALDSLLGATEILVQRDGSAGLGSLAGLLRLERELGAVVVGGRDVDRLGVGDARVLVSGSIREVALLHREANGARSSALAVQLPHEGVVVLNEFPDEGVRCGHHFCEVYGGKINKNTQTKKKKKK